MKLRPATPSDCRAILALNAESVHFLSPLTFARLESLRREAELHLVIERHGTVAAFILAFRNGARYDSVNFRWFQQRFECFLYVDRVVVARTCRGIGAGRMLYESVFAHAEATGVPLVTCEFDIEPPNPISERFHARFGFREVGRQQVAAGRKWVSLQASKAP